METYIIWVNTPYNYLFTINVIRKNPSAKYVYFSIIGNTDRSIIKPVTFRNEISLHSTRRQ